MPLPFWTRHNVDAHTKPTPKRPIPEPLELEDGPRSPCSFMPRHSYSMMMSPAVYSGYNKINYGGGQIFVPDGNDTKTAQIGNEEMGVIGGEVLGSDTTASLCTPMPTSEGFSKAEILIDEAGLVQRSPQFRFLYYISNIRFIGLFLVLLALPVTAALMGSDRVLSFGLDSFALLVSALQIVSVTIEWGLEGIGFLLGRAVTTVTKGFLRGYHLG